jgi:hypothetical protein
MPYSSDNRSASAFDGEDGEAGNGARPQISPFAPKAVVEAAVPAASHFLGSHCISKQIALSRVASLWSPSHHPRNPRISANIKQRKPLPMSYLHRSSEILERWCLPFPFSVPTTLFHERHSRFRSSRPARARRAPGRGPVPLPCLYLASKDTPPPRCRPSPGPPKTPTPWSKLDPFKPNKAPKILCCRKPASSQIEPSNTRRRTSPPGQSRECHPGIPASPTKSGRIRPNQTRKNGRTRLDPAKPNLRNPRYNAPAAAPQSISTQEAAEP